MEKYILNITDLIAKYHKEINKGLEGIYPQGPQSLTRPVHYVLNGGGKRLRPLLTIITAEACGGKKEDIFSAALAVEVLHNFTLVHDDIMDQDHIRHGQKTVHHKWDDGIAILTGDAMLSLALDLLNQSMFERQHLMSIFIEGLLTVCEGQALDKEFETQTSISISDYLHMIDLKTGHMIGLAAEIGTVSACVDEETRSSIRDYGRLLGRAFQIQDDYLEIFSDSNKMGKSLHSDIILGKKTYLMILALEENSKIIKDAILTSQDDFETGMKEIRKYIKNSGIQQKTLNEISNIIELANRKLSQLKIEKDKLLYFSEWVKTRGN